MNDSERTRPPQGPTTAAIGFDGYMARVDARHTHLSMLLDLRDLDPVVEVARSAVKLWLLGRDAYRALVVPNGETSPDVQAAARQRLDATYARLLEVMWRAYAVLDGHPTRNTLDDLRIELVTAAAQLTSDAATTAQPPATDD